MYVFMSLRALIVTSPPLNILHQHFRLAHMLSEFESVILTREGEISVERTSTSNLRRELSRVRRDFIVSTSNRSEQQSALLGSRRKGNSSQTRHCADGDRPTNAWTPGVLPQSSGSRNELSRVEQSALQGARDMVSWNDVFMTKVEVDPSTNANGRRSSGFNKENSRVSGKQAYRQAPESSPPGAPGHDSDGVFNRFLMLTLLVCFVVGTTGHHPGVAFSRRMTVYPFEWVTGMKTSHLS